MLSSKPQGTLYVGNTDNLAKRVSEHKSRAIPDFTATYGVNRLVWFESHETRESAWGREKQLKERKRAWKVKLIEQANPGWLDLYGGLTG